MRFGHFFYPMNFDPSRDYQSIEACLDDMQVSPGGIMVRIVRICEGIVSAGINEERSGHV